MLVRREGRWTRAAFVCCWSSASAHLTSPTLRPAPHHPPHSPRSRSSYCRRSWSRGLWRASCAAAPAWPRPVSARCWASGSLFTRRSAPPSCRPLTSQVGSGWVGVGLGLAARVRWLCPRAAHVFVHSPAPTTPFRPLGLDVSTLSCVSNNVVLHTPAAGMDFDLALRMFMDSFRPPGEGQKIDRIMQVGAVPARCMVLHHPPTACISSQLQHRPPRTALALALLRPRTGVWAALLRADAAGHGAALRGRLLRAGLQRHYAQHRSAQHAGGWVGWLATWRGRGRAPASRAALGGMGGGDMGCVLGGAGGAGRHLACALLNANPRPIHTLACAFHPTLMKLKLKPDQPLQTNRTRRR